MFILNIIYHQLSILDFFSIVSIYDALIHVSKITLNIEVTTGLDGPQKDQVGWRGYLNPKSGSPASILGSPATYSKKAKRFSFPLFM